MSARTKSSAHFPIYNCKEQNLSLFRNIGSKTGYCFVGKQLGSDTYQYLSFNTDEMHISDNKLYIGCSSSPVSIFKTLRPDFFDFWKKISIDGSVVCRDIDSASVRLVKVQVELTDCTTELFSDEADFSDMKRLSSLAKISQTDAQNLGLIDQFAEMRMFSIDEADIKTQNLINDLANACEIV